MQLLAKSAFTGLTAKQIPYYWDVLEPLINKAVPFFHGKENAESIKKSLMERDRQLWASTKNNDIEAIFITEIVVYPKTSICNVFLVAGKNINGWVEFCGIIGAWAKAQGCSALEGFGRPGWEKYLPGWDKTHVIFRKEL